MCKIATDVYHVYLFYFFFFFFFSCYDLLGNEHKWVGSLCTLKDVANILEDKNEACNSFHNNLEHEEMGISSADSFFFKAQNSKIFNRIPLFSNKMY